MKKNFLGLLACLGMMIALPCCKPSPAEWKLVWEDNFDQTGSFDPASWSKIPRGKSDWNNYMSDFDSCYAMRDGKLVLRGLITVCRPIRRPI